MITESTGARTHTQTRTRLVSTEGAGTVRTVAAWVAGLQRVGAWLRVAVVEISRTVTPAGWVAVIVGFIGTAVGIVLGWPEWIAGGVVALLLLLLSVPFLFSARAYAVRLVLDVDRVVAGGAVPARVEIENVGSRLTLPGRVDLPVGQGIVEVAVPLLRARAAFAEPVLVPTPTRGIIRVGPARSVRSDPIGLVSREHEWDDVHTLFVHPRTVAVPTTTAGFIRDLEGDPSSQLVDADMSFHAIRAYLPGDARRQVHWKSTAKTGKLMVRQFEQSRRSRFAVALGVAEADYAGADEYELAVSAAASLGVQAMRDGRAVAVAVGAPIPRVVQGRLRAVRELGAVTTRGLLDEFCAVDALEHTIPVEDVCALQAERATDISIAFVVCGSRVDIARVRRAALAYPAGTAVIVVVCDESAHPRVRPLGDLTVVTIGVLNDLPALLLRGLPG